MVNRIIFSSLFISVAALTGLLVSLLLVEQGVLSGTALKPIGASLAILLFSALIFQWIYWIRRSLLEKDTIRLLLCFLLPYVFTFWLSVMEVKKVRKI